MIPLLKTRGVCLIHCEIRDRSVEIGIVHAQCIGEVSVVDPQTGDRYWVTIPDLESPSYHQKLICQKQESLEATAQEY